MAGRYFLKWLAFGVLAAMLSGCGMHTVDTGYEGIKVRFGQVEGDPLPPGLYMVNPFTETIHQLDTRTQKWDGDTEAYTKDVQDSKVFFTLNYNLQPQAVGTTFRTIGEDWRDKLVAQYVHQHVKDVVGQWDAVDLISSRQQVTDAIRTALTRDLEARGIAVTGFALTGISYSPAFSRAVEAKVIAQQNAQAAQNKTEQIKQEANQLVISATAEAQSMKIRSEALSNNPKLVQWEAVQKWNGTLPQYMLGGNTSLFLPTPEK